MRIDALEKSNGILMNKTEEQEESLEDVKDILVRKHFQDYITYIDFQEYHFPERTYSSCQELYDNDIRKEGVYSIQPSYDLVPFEVYCSFTDSLATTTLIPIQPVSPHCRCLLMVVTTEVALKM